MRPQMGEDLQRAWAGSWRPAPCEVSIELRGLDGRRHGGPGREGSGSSDAVGTVVASRREDAGHYAASTLKVAVLIAALAQTGTGRLDLRDRLEVTSVFPSAAHGTFELDHDDDQDDDTWGEVGSLVSVQQLLERMTVKSSNIATNVVLTHIGLPCVQDVLMRACAPDLAFRRLIGDGRAEQRGVTNTISARGLTQLWSALATGLLLPRGATRGALKLLARQEQIQMIPAGLPSGTWVASKGGWTATVKHDVALVRPNKAPPYVLAVCTTATEPFDARPLIADISEITYRFWTA